MSYLYDFSADIQRKVLNWAGYKAGEGLDRLPPRLGSGAFGTAYKLDNTRVLKVTTDATETTAAAKIIDGFNHPNVYKVFKVGKIKGLTVTAHHSGKQEDVYLIICEYLPQKPNTSEKFAIDGAYDVYGESPKDIENNILKWNNISEKDQQDTLEYIYENSGDVAAKQIRRNERLILNIFSAVSALYSYGVRFEDWHSGNILMRGQEPVLIDLGVSQTKGGMGPIDIIENKNILIEGVMDRETTLISRWMINEFKILLSDLSQTDRKNLKNKYKIAAPEQLLNNVITKDYPLDQIHLIIEFDNNMKNNPQCFVDGGYDTATNILDIRITISFDWFRHVHFKKYIEKLIFNIKQSVRHELEHVRQEMTGDLDMGEYIPSMEVKKYLLQNPEVRAFVAGLYKQAKSQKVPFENLLDKFLNQSVIPMLKGPMQSKINFANKLKDKYIQYARQRFPAAQIITKNESVNLYIQQIIKEFASYGKIEGPTYINVNNMKIRIDIEDLNISPTQHGDERRFRHETAISKDSIVAALERGLGLVINDFANGELQNGEPFCIIEKPKSERVQDLNIVASIFMKKGPDFCKVITVMRKDNFFVKEGTKTYAI